MFSLTVTSSVVGVPAGTGSPVAGANTAVSTTPKNQAFIKSVS